MANNVKKINKPRSSLSPGIGFLLLTVILCSILSGCKPGTTTISPGNGLVPLVFGPVAIVDTNGFRRGNPKVAVDNPGVVYVSWNQLKSTDYVILKKSTNGGSAFFYYLNFPDVVTGAVGTDSMMLIDSNQNLYIAWSDVRESSCFPNCIEYKIYFSKSTDSGDTFSSNAAVDTVTSAASVAQVGSALGLDSDGTIYAAWDEYSSNGIHTGGIDYIYLAKSIDGGSSFGPRMRVSDIPLTRSKPVMQIDSNDNIYIAWMRYTNDSRRVVEVAKSVDKGVSFNTPVQVANADAPHTFNRNPPAMVAGMDGNIYIAWVGEADTNHVIYFSMSTDGGSTFSNPRRLDNSALALENQERPTMAMDMNGTLYIAWQDQRREGIYDIYAARSTTQGTSFEPTVLVDDSEENTSIQLEPHMTTDNEGNVYIVWRDTGRDAVCLAKGS
ncbi:MAG: exo-alpha-sialidase [bacterium]|nr:exo-alpha-sialidase [bacterium]